MPNRYYVIIPARGGSKRLPGKNIRLLSGLPLITHSILYAKLFQDKIKPDDIYVSTEDHQIAKIAYEYGAQVIDRSPSLATDDIPTLPVLQEAIKKLLSTEQIEQAIANHDAVILLQPTNPLRNKKMLVEMMQVYEENLENTAVFSVMRSYSKLGTIENNRFVPYNYKFGQRSQDLTPLYYEDGTIYIASIANILDGNIIGPQAIPYVHNTFTCDIDTIEEFEHAEFLFWRYRQTIPYKLGK